MKLPMAIAAVLLASGVQAADFTDEAQVIAATPIYATVNEPSRDCWNETSEAYRYPEQRRSYAGAALGGITGGVIGNQFGSGNGRVAATAAGAVIGAMTGDRIDNGPSDRSYLGSVLGGVAGGLLGAQIGAGNGRAAAAAVGAVTGALVGDRLDNRQRYTRAPPPAQTGQRCATVDNYRQVVSGYTVLYRYNGREAETVLPYKPGPTIRMGIAPIDGAPVRR
jgi:uncharacterized protein YcfJ